MLKPYVTSTHFADYQVPSIRIVIEDEMMSKQVDVLGIAEAETFLSKLTRTVAIAKGLAKSEQYKWKNFAATIYSVISRFDRS